MHSATALIATLLATTVAALSPIVPPNNPSSNGKQSYCTSRTECLTIINNVRAEQEGLDPIHLPANWGSLTASERLFTFMNLERVSRKISPLTHLVNTQASEVRTAITNDADPMPGTGVGSTWRSIWAGGSNMIPLAAMYGWMYYDGPGGFNLDCTAHDTSGCWGHRDNILAADVSLIDVGAGKDSKGSHGFAALLFSQDQAPSAGQVVLSWADETAHMSG